MKRFCIARPVLVFVYTILALLTLGGAVFLTLFATTGKPEGLPGLIFVLFWVGCLAWTWYAYLRIPVEIGLDEARVHLRSPIRQHTVNVQDILSVKAGRFSPGFVEIRHRGGTVHLMTRMDNFHDLIGSLRKANPAIEVKGC